ncbi:MAG: hypothetical protein IJK42_02260 [Prevotella sp.]|nr:hypothetical protein [Prevotella sp.]
MEKREYIQPSIKIHLKVTHALLNSNTWEQGNDPIDSEGLDPHYPDPVFTGGGKDNNVWDDGI